MKNTAQPSVLLAKSIFAAVAALALGVGVLGFGSPASAHSYLVSSTPAADSTVTQLPESFSVTTNEPLLNLAGDASGFALQVTDAAGRFYGDGCLSIADATLSTGATLGEPGVYKVVWQVISADGHPKSDEFTFTWAPDAGVVATAGESAPPVCGVTGVESTPTPEATVQPAPTPSPEAPVVAAPVSDSEPNDSALWIGGGILAVLAAGVVTFLVVRRKAPGEK